MGWLTLDSLNRSPYWYAVFRSADGRKLKKSTRCVDKRAARIVLQGFEAGELIASSRNATENQIRRVMAETIERVTSRKSFDPSIAEHLAAWLKGEEATIEESSLERYRQVIRDFLTFLGARGKGRLGTVSKDLFLEYRDHLGEAGLSSRSINQTFKILQRPFRVAFDEGLADHNPIGAIKRLKSVSAVKGTFSIEQIQALIAAAPDTEWRALIALGYYTAGRLMDLSRLTWGSVDRQAQTIAFVQKKTGQAVLVPIHPSLAGYLDQLRQGVGKVSILPTLSKKSGTGKSGLSMAFRRIMDKAGIEAGVARERMGAAGRTVSKLSYHALRHSFTSELARAGVAPEVRQLLTGHADLASHKSYTHYQIATLRDAINALGAV
jgi:site-specific recombinase XerD